MSTHSLARTSAKGGPFLGVCTKCGATDLPITAAKDACSNPANLTQAEALEVALGLHDDETKQ